MSTRTSRGNTLASKTLPAGPSLMTSGSYVRNPLWPAVATPTGQEVLALYAVFEGQPNHIACNITCSTGQYNVSLGDGTSTNTASSAIFTTTIDYNNVNLYSDPGLPYKICTVRITPVTGGATFTNTTLSQRPTGLSIANPIANWLEIKVSHTVSTIIIIAASASGTKAPFLENLEILGGNWNPAGGFLAASARNLRRAKLVLSNSTNFSFDLLFSSCNSLTDVELVFAGAGRPNSCANMFTGCSLLEYVPSFDTSAVTNMSGMFSSCSILRAAPMLDTSAVTNMSSMFTTCQSLVTVPLYNTSAVTNMSSMFNACFNLQDFPLFNTAAVLDMSSMFVSCRKLVTVPLYNTSSVTNMGSMFSTCQALETVPLFNTSAVTNMASMFQSCSALETVPLFNTSAVTATNSMFGSCQSLRSVPQFDLSNTTNASTMFGTCASLMDVPALTVGAASAQSMFSGCASLKSVSLSSTSSLTSLNGTFSACAALTNVSLSNTSAVTSTAGMFSGCTALTTAPLFDISLANNTSTMFSSCTALTSVPTYNLATANAVSNMFQSCTGLTEIPPISFTAVNSSGNITTPFASCNLNRIRATGARFTHTIASNNLGATALNEYYTGLPTITSQTLTVTSNYGTTSDNPAIATAKGWTVTGS